jgi:hypothetical protein
VEGIINPLSVRDPWRCAACGYEWLRYDLDDERPDCPRCESVEVAPIGA